MQQLSSPGRFRRFPRLAAGFAFPILSAFAATPASAQALWDGELVVTNTSAGCAGHFAKGDFGRVVLRPAGLGGNGVDSHLTFIQPRWAINTKVTAGSFNGNGNYSATLISALALPSTYQSTFKIMKVSPAPFTASTKTLLLTGWLNKFADVAGCVVTFRAALVKRP